MSSVLFRITIPAPEVDKVALVSFPTDKGWAELVRQRPIILRDLGRGQTETEPQDSPAADLALYQQIRQAESADLDEFEAGVLLRQLEFFQVTGIEREGRRFIVKAVTAGGQEMEFYVGVPSAKNLFEFRKSRATTRSLPHGATRITLHLDPGIHLYDACSGVPTDVSGLWKSKVMDAISAHLDNVTGGDGNFR